MLNSTSIVDNVELLCRTKIDEIISSRLSLVLLKCYSLLYIHGTQPRSCERSQRAYWNQLLNNGLTKANEYMEIQKRTCQPNWNGVKYIPQIKGHKSSFYLTDSDALMLLANGGLSEKDFTKLPDGYSKEEIKAKNVVEEILKGTENEVIAQGSRKKITRKSK